MAIWQYSFNLVDKNYLVTKEEPFIQAVSEMSLEFISDFLPCQTNWSPDITLYGNNDETCVELFHPNDMLESILVRIDLRSSNRELVEKIFEFVVMNDARILANKKIIPLRLEEFLKSIKKSEAFAFCKNPKLFFKNGKRY